MPVGVLRNNDSAFAGAAFHDNSYPALTRGSYKWPSALALFLLGVASPHIYGQAVQSPFESSEVKELTQLKLSASQMEQPAPDSSAAMCKKPGEEDRWIAKDSGLVEHSAQPSKAFAIGAQVPQAAFPSPAGAFPESRAVPASGTAITYSAGRLGIRAQDVALNDILEALKAKTGVQIDYPAGAIDQHVFADIGPAPMQDALEALLAGSEFNYVFRLAPDTHLVKQIIMTPRSGQGHLNVASAPPISNPVNASTMERPEAYTSDPAEANPVPQSAPTAIPTIPASLGLTVTDEDRKKPPAELLDQLQKQQIRLLDAAAAKAAEASGSEPH